jgi:hypothetical protein
VAVSKSIAAAALALVVLSACGASSASPPPTAAQTTPAAQATTVASVAATEALTPTDPPSESPSCTTSDPCEPSASAGATGVVILNGTFSGHFTDGFVTADQGVEAQLHWNAGPDDIHDINAFTFASGGFTFSETIAGDCGGSRTEGGPLAIGVNPQSLLSGDPQSRDLAMVQVQDRRLTGGGVEIVAFASFAVSNADPAGCGDLDRGGVSGCPMVFLQTALGELQQDATCTNESRTVTWTGSLVR